MLMLKPLPVDRSAADAKISVLTFIAHVGFTTQELAHMLASLVRVSRRVEYNHLVTIAVCRRCPTREEPPSTPEGERATTRSEGSATAHSVCSSKESSTRHVHTPRGELPCPKGCPHHRTDDDTQGKKHHAQQDQNQQQRLR